MTDNAARLIVQKLRTLAAQGNEVAEMLNQSTRNGWSDVYPVRRENAQASRTVNRQEALEARNAEAARQWLEDMKRSETQPEKVVTND